MNEEDLEVAFGKTGITYNDIKVMREVFENVGVRSKKGE